MIIFLYPDSQKVGTLQNLKILSWYKSILVWSVVKRTHRTKKKKKSVKEDFSHLIKISSPKLLKAFFTIYFPIGGFFFFQLTFFFNVSWFEPIFHEIQNKDTRVHLSFLISVFPPCLNFLFSVFCLFSSLRLKHQNCFSSGKVFLFFNNSLYLDSG